ncbi:MAG: LCP family protein [Candidatus Promineifilaceae bacterium]
MLRLHLAAIGLTLIFGIAACVVAKEPEPTQTKVALIVTTATKTVTPFSTATPALIKTTTPPATASHTPRLLPTTRPTNTPHLVNPPTVSLTPNLFGEFAPPAPDAPDPAIPYPTPVGVFEKSAEISNILLLGNDRIGTRGRTDTIIIASINTRLKTATLLSIPRDLYVYIPGWQMQRINLAAPHGGVPLLKETILYNLGIEIDSYLRVGFDGFQAIVDALDGVHIAAICPLEDWRLRSPELDPSVEANYVLYKLQSNVHTMDGELALWYARSRRSTSDFDRGRRQQQLLAAMLDKGLRLDVVGDVPALWSAFQGMVETDMPVTTMAQLATLAQAVRENGVRHLALAFDSVEDLRVGEDRSWVQALVWEEAETVLSALQAPPALGRASRSPLTVEVVVENWVDYRLSAENLRWQGFISEYRQSLADQTRPSQTTITYHGPNLKGSYDWLVSWIFHNRPVLLSAEADATHDYTIVLGKDFNPCRSPLYAP